MLYKYMSIKSKSFSGVLENFEVYFASCSRLNDPFEGIPYYSLPNKREIKQYLVMRGVKRGRYGNYIARAEMHFKESQNFFNSNREYRDGTGVLCLTPYNNNLLMWSHYGDEHKGICLGFDIDRPFDSVFGAGYNVEYSDNYPEIPVIRMEELMLGQYSEDKNINKFEDIATRQVYTKATCWEYEQEIRFVRTPFSYGVGPMSFPAEKLKQLILGCKIAEGDKVKAIEIVKKNFPHAEILQSVMSQTQYKIVFEKIG